MKRNNENKTNIFREEAEWTFKTFFLPVTVPIKALKGAFNKARKNSPKYKARTAQILENGLIMNDKNKVLEAIGRGADINPDTIATRKDALPRAIFHCDIEMVKILLEAGAKPDLMVFVSPCKTLSLSKYAEMYGQTEIAEHLRQNDQTKPSSSQPSPGKQP